MSDTPNYRGKAPPCCGFTEAEIEARAASKSSDVWKVRCLNGAAHQHDDKDPSAYYYPKNGWYGCNVCDLKGYATDRLYANVNQQKRVEGRQSRRSGTKRKEFLPDRIPERATLTATYPYTRTDGQKIHRVRRYDWSEDADDGSVRNRKEYLPQHYINGKWQHGTGKIKWEPYNAADIANANIVYVVEGEQCANALDQVTPEGTAVITSAFGTNSAWKSDWTCLSERIAKGDLDLIFIPDCDKPGEKYIHSVAWQIDVQIIKIARVADVKRSDGYDIADWLSEGHSSDQLPTPRETRVISKEEFEERERQDKLLLKRNDHQPSHGIDVEAVDMLNDFNPKPLAWHVKGIIPRGKFTLLFGRKGIGKSTLAMWVAARLSSAQMLFDEPGQRVRTLIYTTEDDWDDTVAVRLKLMQADFQNIGHLRSFENQAKSFDWTKKIEVEALQRHIASSGYGLLIVDPIIHLLGGNHSNNDPAAVRQAIETKLGPILASGCAVIGVHHERKDVKTNQLIVDRALGSQAWTAVARSVIYMQAVLKSATKQRVNVKNRDLNSNSKLYGAVVVGTSNIASAEGGWHYELPLQTYEDHESPHPTIIMRASRITGMSPEALVNQYEPFEAPPKAPTQRLAEMQIKERIDAKKEEEDAKTKAIDEVLRLLDDGSSKKMKEIIDAVSEASGIGRTNIINAVREVCESVGGARNTVWRLKKESS